MSQIGGMAPVVTRKAGSNVYTVLALIGLLALGTSVGVLWYKNVQISGPDQPGASVDSPGQNPWFMVKPEGAP